jgi:MFS family permease
MRARALGPGYRKLFTAYVSSNLGDGVGLVAYAWLASAVTRNAFLVALVVVAQRIPWLVFTLPAGVITDRGDRRVLMVRMDVLRFVIAAGLGVGVLVRQDGLPAPDELESVVGTDAVLYTLVLVSTLLLGMAEVLRDNCAQTLMPSVVEPDQLERANARLGSAELVANALVGPPLGALMLGVAFALPVFFDAASFALSALMVSLIPGVFRAASTTSTTAEAATATDAGPVGAGGRATAWHVELREGVGWLWRHPLLRPMAVTLGLLNGSAMIGGATLVLFSQEVLGTSSTEFALLGMGGALGGVAGGYATPRIVARIGPGACLALVLGVGGTTAIITGFVSHWGLAVAFWFVESFVALLWNTITVSLRQRIIPDALLGRVNSVYRFFAWGMMPVGAVVGGLVVTVVTHVASREAGLRATWWVAGAIQVLLLVFARRSLTTARIRAAESAAASNISVE